jgi:4'-phosphopantetheinyl transferase
MEKMEITRWAFNTECWSLPSAETQIRLLGAEETERIGKFVFEKDAKLACAGRLLLFKFVAQYATQLNIQVENIPSLLRRTKARKPYLVQNHANNFFVDFNLSHSGEYVIFTGISGVATESNPPFSIGCDVQKIEIRGRNQVRTVVIM